MIRSTQPLRLAVHVLVPVCALAAAPLAQTDMRAVTESYDPLSPELATYSASDMVVVNSDQLGTEEVPWTAAELGLPVDANLDAFTDGSDIFPVTGPTPLPPLTCRTVLVEYTVDRVSAGLPLSLVNEEFLTDGAASDTFGALFSSDGGVTYSVQSDALEVTPRGTSPFDPLETDLDALSWMEIEFFPVWHSLDPPSAAALGFSPADILLSTGGGSAPVVFVDAASLGLVPGDDIDGLAHDGFSFVFSLSRSSPSVSPGGVWESPGPAGLLVYVPGSGIGPWATPELLQLAPSTDDLNGVRITDPVSISCLNGAQPDPTGGPFPYATVRIQQSFGNAAGLVFVHAGQSAQLQVKPPQSHVTFLFGRPGRPCLSEEFFLPGILIGSLSFDPLAAFDLSFLPQQVVIFPQPPGMEFTFQGVNVNLATFQVFATNAVTFEAR